MQPRPAWIKVTELGPLHDGHARHCAILACPAPATPCSHLSIYSAKLSTFFLRRNLPTLPHLSLMWTPLLSIAEKKSTVCCVSKSSSTSKPSIVEKGVILIFIEPKPHIQWNGTRIAVYILECEPLVEEGVLWVWFSQIQLTHTRLQFTV